MSLLFMNCDDQIFEVIVFVTIPPFSAVEIQFSIVSCLGTWYIRAQAAERVESAWIFDIVNIKQKILAVLPSLATTTCCTVWIRFKPTSCGIVKQLYHLRFHLPLDILPSCKNRKWRRRSIPLERGRGLWRCFRVRNTSSLFMLNNRG